MDVDAGASGRTVGAPGAEDFLVWGDLNTAVTFAAGVGGAGGTAFEGSEEAPALAVGQAFAVLQAFASIGGQALLAGDKDDGGGDAGDEDEKDGSTDDEFLSGFGRLGGDNHGFVRGFEFSGRKGWGGSVGHGSFDCKVYAITSLWMISTGGREWRVREVMWEGISVRIW